jgi:hypothetical protein
VAARLKICPRSVWSYAARGILPRPIALRGRRLWLATALDEALAKLHESAQRPDGGEGGRP